MLQGASQRLVLAAVLCVLGIGVAFAVQTITTQPSFSVSPPVLMPRRFINFGQTSPRNYDVMPDGRILGFVAAGQTQSAEFTPQIQVVLNWQEELQQRVPTR